MPKSNYQIVPSPTNEILCLKDIGPWDKFMTITNNAENVVEELWKTGRITGQPLVYFDSEGELTQLRYSQSGKFVGFAFPNDELRMIAEMMAGN